MLAVHITPHSSHLARINEIAIKIRKGEIGEGTTSASLGKEGQQGVLQPI